MIKHVVLWKLRDFAEGSTKEENAKKIKHELESLKGKITCIGALEVGINSMPSEASYDVALYASFATKQDLDQYLAHPEHQMIAQLIAKVREDRVVVDYQTD